MEVWKDIEGFEGLYQVSNLGRIKSLPKKNGCCIQKNEKIMKQFDNKNGYLCLSLSKNNKWKTYVVHQLVANAFLDRNNFKSMNYENKEKININKLDINHKNENKKDNRVENLEYCTRSYNNCYRNKIKIITDKISKKVNQYDLQGNFIKMWKSTREVERTLGINHTSISFCCNGKYKKAGGYIWKYVD